MVFKTSDIAQEAKDDVLSLADGMTGRMRKHLAASADEVTAHVDDKIDALKTELLGAIAALDKSKED